MRTYCIFSAQYLPTLGGVERYTYNLARKITEHGGRAVVVTSALPGLPARETQEGIEVYRLPSLLPAGGRLPLVKKNAETKALLARLAQEGVDRVVVQTRLYRLSLLGLQFAREQGLPAILIEHGSGYVTHENPLMAWALKRYEHWLLAGVRKYAPALYGVSEQSCDWLRRLGFSPAGVLHNSIDPAAVQAEAAAAKRDWRAEYSVPDGTLCIACAGRLVASKGAPRLAQAVVQYNAARPKASPPLALFIAGDGPLGPQDFPQDPAVHLLGALPHGETMGLFSQCAVYCLPSAYPEGLPTTLMEAAACRCMLITTPAGGSAEIVCGEEYGILVPDNAPATLAAALSKAAADEGYRQGAAQNAYGRVCEHFTFDALYRDMAAVWPDVPQKGEKEGIQ